MEGPSSTPPTVPAVDSQQMTPANEYIPAPPVKTKGTRTSTILIVIGLLSALVVSNVVWSFIKVQDDREYDSLNADLTELQQNHTSLETSYANLQADHASLQQSYNMLQTENQIYENFRLESTVEDYYETVRDTNSMQTSDWWYSYISIQDKVDFCANLAKHDIAKVYWSSIETAYHDYYGTYSYDDAKARLTFSLDLAGVHSYDTSVDKIDKILKYVASYISYRPDMNDRYNSPWETLAFQSGDCDDFSTLASALFELAGIDSAIEFVKNSANNCHAMVLVKLNDLGPYGYYYYSDLTSYGLSAGNWIVIEPQMSIDQQHDSTWMSQWSIMAAADT